MLLDMLHTNGANPSTSNIPATFASEDSKYAVADILTSFASGEPSTPTSLFSAITTTTDLLTPTTLVNLEQSLIDFQAGAASNLSRESGFVPPVVNPVPGTSSTMVKQEYSDYMYQDDSSQDSDWLPSASKQARFEENTMVIHPYQIDRPPGTPGRRRKIRDEHQVSMEELGRRQVRRERNKLAAAKCRQRRVDLTNTLLVESEGLEEDQSKLENEIQMLQQQKEQLAFLLEAHRPNCSAGVTHTTHTTVKCEKSDAYPSVQTLSSSSPSLITSTYQTITSSIVLPQPSVSVSMSRPSSLSIPTKPVSMVTEVTGVPITTPSGVFSFGLDSMLDGHTGLTPITGTPSCASQMQRNSTDGSSSPDNMSSPTTLMAL